MMTILRGRAENGQDKYTFVFEWPRIILIGLIIGLLAGFMLGRTYEKGQQKIQQIETWEATGVWDE
jgi:hypothetical protein